MPATAPGRSTCPASKSTPGHQGHGIGSRIISTLLEEAQRQGQDLVLDGPYTLSDGIAAFAGHSELHNGTGEMQPDHT